MFSGDVSEPYGTLNEAILKRKDLTDRQRLNQTLHNTELKHGSATKMLLCVRKVSRRLTFDGGHFRQEY